MVPRGNKWLFTGIFYWDFFWDLLGFGFGKFGKSDERVYGILCNMCGTPEVSQGDIVSHTPGDVVLCIKEYPPRLIRCVR
jgi:hypothetical protein